MDIKPNPGCANSLCCKLQQAYQQHQASPAVQQQRQAAQQAAAMQQEEAATHDDNEWGIEVVSEPASSQPPQQSAVDSNTQQQNRKPYDHSLPKGLQYETPVSGFSACCFMLVGPVLRATCFPKSYHAYVQHGVPSVSRKMTMKLAQMLRSHNHYLVGLVHGCSAVFILFLQVF